MDNNDNVVKCGIGWKHLYEPIIDKVTEYDLTKTIPTDKIGINKIKSSNGLLNIDFYNPNNLTQEIKQRLIDSKIMSMITCEYCGTEKDIGFTILEKEVKTCCESCFKEQLEIENPKLKWTKRKQTNQSFLYKRIKNF